MEASLPFTKHTAWIDRLIALALGLMVLFCAFRLTPAYPAWEDDYAAYLNEGIAIAEGRFTEQTKLNKLLHLAETPNPAKGDALVYAWGYPLLIAGLNRIAGFDRNDLSSIGAYKQISCITLGLFAAAVYLLFRKRFSRPGALLGALLSAFFAPVFRLVSEQYSDIPFMAWLIVCFLLMERALETEQRSGKIVFGLLFGLAAGYAKALRLNGSTVLFAFAVAWADRLISGKKKLRDELLLPLCVLGAFLLFDVVMNRLVLAPATSNMDDFSGLTVKRLFGNARFYAYTVRDHIADTLTLGFENAALRKGTKLIATALLLVAALGCIPAFKKEKYLLAFSLVTVLGCIALPYTQGGRYVFPLMPVFFLLTGYGFGLIGTWLNKLCKRFPVKKAGQVLALVLCAVMLTVYGARCVKTNNPAPRSGSPYAKNVLGLWAYINEELPEDAVVFTQKPRLVYLNTGRLAYAPCYGHTYADCDYVLDIKNYAIGSLFKVTDTPFEQMIPVYECSEGTLYKIEFGA